MNKTERESFVRQLERGKKYEALMRNEGFLFFLEELRGRREKAVQSLITVVESHPTMSKNAGKVDALDDVIAMADKAIKAGKEAAKRLNGKGDISEGDESEE